jgi:hypothetical protein
LSWRSKGAASRTLTFLGVANVSKRSVVLPAGTQPPSASGPLHEHGRLADRSFRRMVGADPFEIGKSANQSTIYDSANLRVMR